jgi:hypothetical protein
MAKNHKVVSISAMLTVIERYQLQPVDGEYKVTEAMIAEAAAIDKANGDPGPSPEQLKDLEAAMNGRPPPNGTDWKPMPWDND